jgi:phosphatidylserine/phosphatidylglycerophosphate/cardiolipin synthase-like enzyme
MSDVLTLAAWLLRILYAMSIEGSSTRQLVERDLEAAASTPSRFSSTFVNHVSHDQRAQSTPLDLTTGTGYHIYTSFIIPQILSATKEVIIVTCFWAESATRDALHNALLELSAKAVAAEMKISVHICFSTYSLARNMLLPTPKKGQNYKPSKWRKLGLPHSSRVPGLVLRVTRKFNWPFGIMHSKYVVIDREIAILPSCNVSWERWLEAAVSISGPAVAHLLKFHAWFWENGASLKPLPRNQEADSASTVYGRNSALKSSVPTTILPSPHTPLLLPPHLHPSALLHQLPCLPSLPPSHPPTPLLTTTSHLLSTAQHSIFLTTPNVTAPSVLALLRNALSPPRNVDVTIWTNTSLMTLEQLVTAGSTTPRCLRSLQRWHSESSQKLGKLTIHYFDDPSPTRPGPGTHNARSVETTSHGTSSALLDSNKETTPIKLHAKITIVDGDKLLLGSCNMDAASWGTSQELGILLESRELVDLILERELKEKLIP